jgi:hypothetical protein
LARYIYIIWEVGTGTGSKRSSESRAGRGSEKLVMRNGSGKWRKEEEREVNMGREVTWEVKVEVGEVKERWKEIESLKWKGTCNGKWK